MLQAFHLSERTVMQVRVENLSSVKKTLHIEIPEKEVNREIDNAYNELKKNAKIKGFRPGKAPRSVLERLYKKDVNADVSAKLIQESLEEAIRENQISMVGQPQISPPELKYKAAYAFDATLEVAPELEEIDFKGLHLKKNMYTAKEHEVQGQLEMLRRNLVRQKAVEEERPVQDGDFVLIDYEGFLKGQPFEAAQKTENYTLKIGSAQIAEEIDEQLIGMFPGQSRDIPVTFPPVHANADLAGKEILFQVNLKEIREEIVPEIDDAFAKNFGEKYETLDQLKTDIVKNLEEGYSRRQEHEIREQIFTALLERKDFEVPDTMIEYELAGIVSEAEQSFAYHNVNMDDIGVTRDSLAEKYRPMAVKQVKRHLILGKLIEQEKLDLSDEETEAGLQEMAAAFQQPVDEIKRFYQENSDKLNYFRHTLLEKKAMNLIIDSSSIEEVEPDETGETEESAE